MERTAISERGSPRPGESSRALQSRRGRNLSLGGGSPRSGDPRFTRREMVQDATFLWDVLGTRRRAAVNQRPAGSREGYVWLPKWIGSTNSWAVRTMGAPGPQVIESTNPDNRVHVPAQDSLLLDQRAPYSRRIWTTSAGIGRARGATIGSLVTRNSAPLSAHHGDASDRHHQGRAEAEHVEPAAVDMPTHDAWIVAGDHDDHDQGGCEQSVQHSRP